MKKIKKRNRERKKEKERNEEAIGKTNTDNKVQIVNEELSYPIPTIIVLIP